LQGYPAGLGKGHDAAVVGAWLDEELVQIPPTFAVAFLMSGEGLIFWLIPSNHHMILGTKAKQTKDPGFSDHLEVLRWGCNAINRFWRLVYSSSLWVPRNDAKQLVDDGFRFTDPCFMLL